MAFDARLDAAVQAAHDLQQRGRLVEAEAAYRQLIAQAADVPILHDNLGVTLAQLGRVDEAIPCFQQALSLAPRLGSARHNLIRAWLAVGDLNAAADSCETYLRQDPHNGVALALAGDIALRLDRPQEALTAFERALRVLPGHDQARLGRTKALRALQLRDDLNSLGRLVAQLGRLGKYREAIEVLNAQLAKNPEEAAVHAALGQAYALAGDAEPSRWHFTEALRCGWHDGVRVNRAIVLPPMLKTVEEMGRVRARQLDEFRELAGSGLVLTDPHAQVGLTNFYLAYHGHDDRPWQEALSALYRQLAPSLAYTAPHCREGASPRPPGPIRVGFASSYLCGHTISRLNSGLIEHLDRERFHVTVIPLGARDAETERLAGLADAVLYPEQTLTASREQIAGLALDVLIYPDIGMEATTYFLAYARLAPVQVVTWGHPVTTGIPTVDYFLSDASLEPAGAQAHYSERLVNLGALPCHYERPPLPDTPAADRALLDLSPTDRLYVCPQSLFKLHPEFDAYLTGILDRDPLARLVFIAGPKEAAWRQMLCDRLAALRPGTPQHLLFVGKLSRMDFLRLLRTADVLLDPIHFGSGNSAYEAIAVGTPVVTQPGAFMRGRVTAACYQAIGVTDCIAADRETYVDTAVAIATTPSRRQALVARIVANGDRLFSDDQAVRRLEAFLADAVAGRDMDAWAFEAPSAAQ